LTHTIPLLLAGVDCSFMDFDGVRALVVLPELPVAGGPVGVVTSVVPEELEDWRALPFDSLVRELVVLPELVPAVGSFVEFAAVEPEALSESFDALFDFLLLADPVLPCPAAGVSPVGGVALAEGSAAALFFGLLVAVGVVFAFSPSVFPALSLLVLDLLREEVPEAPELLVVLAVPAASFESLFFVVLVFFAVVEVSPELASDDFAASVESAAGFFFFFLVAVESLCDGSVDCVDCRPPLACVALTTPNSSSSAANTVNQKRFFMLSPGYPSGFKRIPPGSREFLPLLLRPSVAVVRPMARQDVPPEDLCQYSRGCS
jgi:hypothetical protein